MENLSYYVERIALDRYEYETDKNFKYETLTHWKQTARGKFLSKHQVADIQEIHEMAGDRIVLVIKFALSPRDVTFFNLKFGK